MSQTAIEEKEILVGLLYQRPIHQRINVLCVDNTEIVEFCRFLEPTPEETAGRYAAIARVTDVVQSLFPRAEVQVFGSFVTGAYLSERVLC